jgi:hypothetical protein
MVLPTSQPAPVQAVRQTSAETRVRTTATEEELELAYAGGIQPRSPVLPSPTTGRPLGKKFGLPIQMTWAFLFQREAAQPETAKVADEFLTKEMEQEFPGRENQTFKAVAAVRRYYNNGGMTRGRKPRIQSVAKGEGSAPPEAPPVAPPVAKPPVAAKGVAAIKASAARVAAKKAKQGTGQLANPAR